MHPGLRIGNTRGADGLPEKQCASRAQRVSSAIRDRMDHDAHDERVDGIPYFIGFWLPLLGSYQCLLGMRAWSSFDLALPFPALDSASNYKECHKPPIRCK